MEQNNLEQLKKLAKVFNTDNVITSAEIEQVLSGIMSIMASFRKENIQLTEEYKTLISDTLAHIEKINQDTDNNLSTKSSALLEKIDAKLAIVNDTLAKVKKIKPVHGKDGKDGVNGINGKDGKDGSPDTGEQIITKINDSDGKIKAERIEGVDKLASQDNLDRAISILDQRTQFLINKRTGGVNSVVAGTNITVDNTDPTNPIVSSSGGGTPGGALTSIQYNNAGAFDGTSKFLYDGNKTITFGQEGTFATITGPNATTSNTRGGDFVFSGGIGNGTGRGGYFTFEGGAGGAIGAGGGFEILGGNGANGGNIYISGGNSVTGDNDGGSVTISSGYGSNAGLGGEVVISLGSDIAGTTLGSFYVENTITGASSYLNFANVVTNQTFTFPNNTGTLALTSDLLTYVPYTGATGPVDLGAETLTAANLVATNSLFLGAVNTEIKSSTLGVWTVVSNDGDEANIDANNLTADRTYTLPDATGTIALTSDLSSYVPYTGATGAVDLGANNLTVDTNTLFVDATNNRVGVGTISPSSQLTIKGNNDATFEVAGSTAGRRGLFTYNNAPAVFELDVDTNFRLKTGSNYAIYATNGTVTIGAASAAVGTLRIPVAPTASANYGLVNLGSGAFDGATAGFFTGNSNGTVVAVNAASGYTGDLISLQVAGAKKFKVFSTGFVGLTSTNTGFGEGSSSGIDFYQNTAPGSGQSSFNFYGRVSSNTSGTSTHFDMGGKNLTAPTGYAAASGTGSWIGARLDYTLNNTGTYSGTATGLYLNATETSVTGTTHNLMDLQVGGVSKATITNGGNIIASNYVRVGGSSAGINLRAISSTVLGLRNNADSGYVNLATGLNIELKGTNGNITSEAGNLGLYPNNSIVGFMGTTSSFPALKRSTTSLEVRLADDSAYTRINALNFNGVALVTGGTATKYLSEDGTYTTPAGGAGLTNWTEAYGAGTQATSSFKATNAAANVNAALVAKGTGATVAQIPDATTAGGDSRGQYATDWQKVRNSSDMVASGNYSTIGGGERNKVVGSWATVAGGYNNRAAAGSSTVTGGESNNISAGSAAVIGGGSSNVSTQDYTFIGGGISNSITGAYGVIAGGNTNTVSATNAIVSGGSTNTASGQNSGVTNGFYAEAHLYGERAFAAGRFGALGDAQAPDLLWRTSITGTSATELFLDGASVQAILKSGNTVWNAKIQVVATTSSIGNGGGAVGNSFSGEYLVSIKRLGTSTTLVGTVQTIATTADTNMTASVVTITADDTTEALKITFTPDSATAGSTTVTRVVARGTIVEVRY